MGKDIVVFSDGTGQDGGVRPEQRLSNVFKMYRAARSGPDSAIDPNEQVCFYDPGLGTAANATGMTSLRRAVSKLISSATGRGITTNIADCYEFIINHYRSGDRIWLFGFSRGAYTARCVANVLMLCGVPTKSADGPLARFRSGVREIADRAVIRVYEHGAGHDRGKFDAERYELARRFRRDFGSGDDLSSNAAPHFVGVFDTVASLGAKGPLRVGLWLAILLSVILVASLVAAGAHTLFGLHWSTGFAIAAALTSVIAAWSYLRTALKSFRPADAQGWAGRPRFHLAQWSGTNFDRLLSGAVPFARHAIAIDENRADFPRLLWGWGKGVTPPVKGPDGVEPFVQMWFAGNHSDIGGSYPEQESRLSDIALAWMVGEARSVPQPMRFDDRLLNVFPSADGVQHDEIAGMSDTIRARTPALFRWLTRGWTWPSRPRDPKRDALLHPTVAQRAALAEVPCQGGDGPYRPEALRGHVDLVGLYGPGEP